MQHHAAITMRFAASTRKPAPIYAQNKTRMTRVMQPFQCDLQPIYAQNNTRTADGSATGDSKTPYNYAHTSSTADDKCSHSNATVTLRQKKRQTDRSRNRRTHEVPFIAACSHFTRKTQGFVLRLSKTPYNYAHKSTPKAASSHRYTAAKKKRQTDRSRNRRTHEVPFIVACSHFTRTNARFRAPASSPTHHLPSSPLPFLTTSHRHHLASSPLPFLTTSHRHHVPSSPPPFVHFPSSPLPFLTTPLHHHFPSSPPPFVHFPSSPLPFLTTPLPHHSPSSSLPFVTTSHRPHLPSSPLPFVTTSLRHHFSSSPPVIITTLHQDQFHRFLFLCYVLLCFVLLCNLPPFIISSLRILFVRNTEVLLPNFL